MGTFSSTVSLLWCFFPHHFSRWAFVPNQYCMDWQIYIGYIWDWSLDIFWYRALVICNFAISLWLKGCYLRGKWSQDPMVCHVCPQHQQLIVSHFSQHSHSFVPSIIQIYIYIKCLIRSTSMTWTPAQNTECCYFSVCHRLHLLLPSTEVSGAQICSHDFRHIFVAS